MNGAFQSFPCSVFSLRLFSLVGFSYAQLQGCNRPTSDVVMNLINELLDGSWVLCK